MKMSLKECAMEMSLKELVDKMKEVSDAMNSNAAEQVLKGNKAAGARARKASLELGKLVKHFRAVSVKAA